MIGNPITLTSNVSSKTITTTATQGQTNFTVTGGYRINQISVFRNGVKLASDDYQARDGATVTLTVGANNGDTIEFQIFDDFRVANALDVNIGGNIGGNVNVSGVVTASSFVGNFTGNVTGTATTAQSLSGTPNIVAGVVTATRYFGDGSTLTGIALSTTANINTSGIGTFGTVVATNDLDIPNGTTAQRFATPVAGSIRYNSEYNILEIYTGTEWRGFLAQPLTPSPTDTALFAGSTNTIDYITIASTGNAIDFGDLTVARGFLAACSSISRGVFGGGSAPGPTTHSTIDYVNIAILGNAIDFGSLTIARSALAACSSSTRGVFGGGYISPALNNTIDYITIASTGNAIDFGDLTVARGFLAATSNATRGVFGGGGTPTQQNTIDYITIASTGNAIDFGDLTVARGYLAACSSSTRGVFGGGLVPAPAANNTIDYITIASTGNAIDFGDLTVARGFLAATSNATRGVFGGGNLNTIDYITIASTGNAIDFGDLTVARGFLAACSSDHGGLQ